MRCLVKVPQQAELSDTRRMGVGSQSLILMNTKEFVCCIPDI